MNEQYYQTLKSVETEDWLDFHIIRPFCFQLARLFAKFDINHLVDYHRCSHNLPLCQWLLLLRGMDGSVL